MEGQRVQQGKEAWAMSDGAALEQQRIRTERALSLIGGGLIRFQPDGGHGWVALDAEGEAHHVGTNACDCEDFLRRCAPLRIRCKHMEALRIAAQSFPPPGPREGENGNAGPPGAALMQLLGAPFSAEAVHWKPQRVSAQGNRALAVAYLDAREVAERLDESVGPLGWQVLHQVLGDQLVTGIGIRDPATGAWVWKWDSGFVGRSPEEDEKESGESSPGRRPDDEEKARKGTLSDGLKRAAVLWGIGRYLYRLPKVWVAHDPRTKSLAETPRLPSWALPAAPREPRSKGSKEEGLPPQEAVSGPAGVACADQARAAPNPGQSATEGPLEHEAASPGEPARPGSPARTTPGSPGTAGGSYPPPGGTATH